MNLPRRTLCLFLFCTSVLTGAEIESISGPKADLVPGVALSQGITEITGVAISPLLGVSSVGAWRYWKTEEAARDSLPWYAQPWAWGTGLGLLALCFLKDSLGTAVPGILKKPFDMVELFENKASALVASGAFVPLIAQEMVTHLQTERAIAVPSGSIMGMSVAMVDASWVMIPAAVVAFLLVFVCSHAINVMIILSPFSTLDALLKLVRTGVLVAVGVIYLIAPWLAAVVCVGIIVVAAWLAPAAMRLAIFGARYAGDILFPGQGRARATPAQPHAFTMGRVAGLPPRTGGRLELRDDGSAVFRYRRWCMLDECVIPLPEGSRHVEKGLFSPSLVYRAGESDEAKMLVFLPRYRGHEEKLAAHLKLQGVREHSLVRGFAAVKSWIRGMFRSENISEA
jgi:hypothetical protein